MAVPFDARAIVTVVQRTLDELAIVGAPATWALSNHDTPRVVSRVRGQGMSEAIARSRARSLALIAHILPGAVYVYQGEELGLADAPIPDSARQDPVWFRTQGAQAGRDAARVPLPWHGDRPPYGFSDASDIDTWLPQPEGWESFTAEFEAADPSSTLSQYSEMLRLRHSRPEFADLENAIIDQLMPGVVRIRRGQTLACIVNCSDAEVRMPLDGRVLVTSADSAMAGGEYVTLPPAIGVWIETATR
jgi:alpha-glucosidase